MRILILGGDGYLGWPMAMYFSARGHETAVLDNFSKRQLEIRLGTQPLVPVSLLHKRVQAWKSLKGKTIELYTGDLVNHRYLYQVLEEFQPEAIVHLAEQPSAPYSMMGREQAVFTQTNNVVGNLNLLFAMAKHCPDAHLIKLGTMGEYGTPNIDIEEGFIEIEHKGRKDILPYPKQPFSFYHLSKVHDSHNIQFACKVWGLRSTDLNQGVVYGIDTDETKIDPVLQTSFHYDDVFGTVLNRFCVEAAIGTPLTVYGKGGQTRGFLNIMDTMQCIELSALNPAKKGEYRVFNQITETFSINDLAGWVQKAGKRLGVKVEVAHLPNPRTEKEEHYYNVKHTKLMDLGLKPHPLTEEVVVSMLQKCLDHRESVTPEIIQPKVLWHSGAKVAVADTVHSEGAFAH